MASEYPPPYEVSGTETDPVQQTEQSPVGSCLKWLVFFLILLIAGVSMWWFYFREKKGEETKKEETKKEEIKKDSNIIGPDGGTASQNGVKIIVPKGALDREVKISIEKVREGRITALYHLKPDGLVFSKPVKVVIPYNAERLYSWETPYLISLFSGDLGDYLPVKNRTSVNVAEEKVNTEITKF